MTVQEAEFLKNRGDKLWLKGIQYLPAKIKNLLYLNKVLAHQPWLVKTQHIIVRVSLSPPPSLPPPSFPPSTDKCSLYMPGQQLHVEIIATACNYMYVGTVTYYRKCSLNISLE